MKPIFINSSPNTETDDVLLALKEIIRPWNWSNGQMVTNLELKIENIFGQSTKAVAFDSARSSFFEILKVWKVGSGDEVLVPAFTCTVIVNPILWVGATPIYVDVDRKSLNIDLEDLEKKITSKTKVILAQHTFGLPLDMERVMKIAKKYNVKVVEDCAHSFGLSYKNKLLGAYGDAAVITFGISKVASGVRGGMAITKDIELYNKLKQYQLELPTFPMFHTFKFLLNPIIWFFVTPIYYLGIGKTTLGKLIILVLQKLKILGIDNIVEPCENFGQKPNWLPTKMSSSLSKLASNQLSKLDRYNTHRKILAKIYSEILNIPLEKNCLYLRFPVYVENKELVLEYFRKNRIMLGDWYKSILHIPKENYSMLKYKNNSCPNTEYAVEHIVNLPTFIKVSESDVMKIADMMKQFVDYELYKRLSPRG